MDIYDLVNQDEEASYETVQETDFFENFDSPIYLWKVSYVNDHFRG